MSDSFPNKRFTRREREDFLSRFDASGLNAKRFARERALKYATLLYWLKARRESPKAQSFVELSVDDRRESSGTIEIFLDGGVSLRVFTAGVAARLLKELGARC
jgi:hypothetical protein